MASLYSELLYFSCLISWEHYIFRATLYDTKHMFSSIAIDAHSGQNSHFTEFQTVVSGKYFWINWGCGRFFGLDYAAMPRLRRYSIGLIASKDILIRSSLYQRRKPSSSYMNSSRETPSQDLV